MDVIHVGLVNRDPCGCKVKGFCVVSSIKRNVSKRHFEGVRQWRLEKQQSKMSRGAGHVTMKNGLVQIFCGLRLSTP